MGSLMKLVKDSVRGLPLLVGIAAPRGRSGKSTPARSLAHGDYCVVLAPAKKRRSPKTGYRRSA